MTRRFAHVLAVGYALTALALAHMAVVSWRAGSWPYAAFLAGASLLLMTATVHHSWQSSELRYALAQLEEATRPPAEPTPCIDGVVSVALAAACCEMWWTSAGAEHEAGCDREQESA